MGVAAREAKEGAMLLALIFSVQAATAAPNPCADQMSMLCKISPLFCPSAYPSDLTPGSGNVPCWPERTSTVSRDTRVVNRPSDATVKSGKGATSPSAAANPSPRRGDGSARGEARGFLQIG